MRRHGRGASAPRPPARIAIASALVALVGPGGALAQDAAPTPRQAAGVCSTCHGLDGIAKQPDMPNIAGSDRSYLVRQLQAFKTGERKHEVMTVVAQGLSDQQIEAAAEWYSSIEVQTKVPQ